MYCSRDILSGFNNILAWREESGILPGSLSQSGRYYQDFHPLATLRNLRSIVPADIDFKEWIDRKTDASILSAISIFCNTKVAEKTGKHVLEDKRLFTGAGSMSQLDAKANNYLVGFEVNVNRSPGLAFNIREIGTQFTEAITLPIYIYHSSMYYPLLTLDIKKMHANTMEWTLFDDELKFSNEGGSYYIVYSQNSLGSASAIVYDRDWSMTSPFRSYCSRCNNDYEVYRTWSQYIEVIPFYAYVFDFDYKKPHLWDISRNQKTNNSNHGLNMKIQLECDYTNTILYHKNSFIDYIGYHVAADMLKELAVNANHMLNRTQQMIQLDKSDLMHEIGESGPIAKSGLSAKRDRCLKNLSIDFSRIHGECFPRNNKGIRMLTV